MSDAMNWQYGREPVDPSIMIDGKTPESDHRLYGSENPLLIERRRKYEEKRDLDACDYSLDSLDV